MMEGEELREESNVVELKREFETLLSSRPWRMVITAVQSQIDDLQNQVLFGQVTCEGDVYRQERLKGQLEGRLALRGVAETLLETLEMDVKQLKENNNGGE